MMENNKRIDKSFFNLASFAEEILVQCPHCGKRATVIAQLNQFTVPFPKPLKCAFRCYNCYKNIKEDAWFGPIIIYPITENCAFCGSYIGGNEKIANRYQSEMKVRCKVCGQERFYKTHYKLTYANSHQATDPYYGLQLWLQSHIDDNIFWAYNFNHLQYLKSYVSAKLREATNGGKYSLAWKLPNFIKIAKNRVKILKTIDRLEKLI